MKINITNYGDLWFEFYDEEMYWDYGLSFGSYSSGIWTRRNVKILHKKDLRELK